MVLMANAIYTIASACAAKSWLTFVGWLDLASNKVKWKILCQRSSAVLSDLMMNTSHA